MHEIKSCHITYSKIGEGLLLQHQNFCKYNQQSLDLWELEASAGIRCKLENKNTPFC